MYVDRLIVCSKAILLVRFMSVCTLNVVAVTSCLCVEVWFC